MSDDNTSADKNSAGTTQPARHLTALADSYFSIEERTFSEWVAYLRTSAKHLQFFDCITGGVNGNWSGALPDNADALALEELLAGKPVKEEIKQLAARPDMAALLAFFSIMQYPKSQFDQLTADHKQHYYRDVLGFRAAPARPDTVHLVVGITEDLEGFTLPEGTRFGGPSDSNGTPLIYATESDAALNHARVEALSALSSYTYKDKEKKTDTSESRIRKPRVFSRYIDQAGCFSLEGTSGVMTMGDNVTDTSELSDRQEIAKTGFCLSSPSLYLSGGKRVIRLVVNRAENTEDSDLLLSEWFDISVSTAEGMVLLSDETRDVSEPPTWEILETKDTQDDLKICFEPQFPPISGIEGELAPGVSPLPHLLFSLKPVELATGEEEKSAILQKQIFTSIDIHVEVEGLHGVVASNANGVLDTTAPFEPLTFQPQKGSKFAFTHPELLLKPIDSASITFEWVGRPASFSEHYKSYSYYQTLSAKDEEPDKLPEDYNWSIPKLTFSRSDGIDTTLTQPMFGNPDAIINNIESYTLPFVPAVKKTHGEEETDQQPLEANGKTYTWSSLPMEDADPEKWPKYYSFSLSGSDFGHTIYGQVSQYIAYLNTTSVTNGKSALMVSEPYTPLTQSVSINYQSLHRIEALTLGMQTPPSLQFIHPVGRPRIPAKRVISLLPRLPESAYLFVGVAGATTPGKIRLYFQIDPVDGSNISEDRTIAWKYLTPNGWLRLPGSADGAQKGSARIVEDSTQSLLNSGIIVIELPEMDESKSGLGDGLVWLQMGIFDRDEKRYEAIKYSRIRGVYTQGVAATLVSDGVEPQHFDTPLLAESVSELEEEDPTITQVLQPWPSFGARPAESDHAIEVRASERLRHKHRALTKWDFEHLVLNEFPEVYMARCHAPVEKSSELTNVELTLIPVNHDPEILQPKLPLHLHGKICQYLEKISSAGVNLSVRDPAYEQVSFDVALKIFEGFDIDSVVGQINQMLISYLTPWQKSDEQEVTFNSSIYLTDISAMLETHQAVDKVHYLRAEVKFKDSEGHELTKSYGEEASVIFPEYNASILVPSRNHKVILVDTEVNHVDGIDKRRIEVDFTVE